MNNESNTVQTVLKNGPIELPSRETIQACLRQGPLTPEPLAYDINQAAAALNMSTKSVRRLLRRGKLTCCKVMRKILIPRQQIEEFFKRNCDTPKWIS